MASQPAGRATRRAMEADVESDDRRGWLSHGLVALAISALGLGVAGSLSLTTNAQTTGTDDPPIGRRGPAARLRGRRSREEVRAPCPGPERLRPARRGRRRPEPECHTAPGDHRRACRPAGRGTGQGGRGDLQGRERRDRRRPAGPPHRRREGQPAGGRGARPEQPPPGGRCSHRRRQRAPDMPRTPIHPSPSTSRRSRPAAPGSRRCRVR